MVDPDGVRTDAILVASPRANTKHVLAITCVAIPRLGPDPEIFLFHGGFDAPETMTDPTKESGFWHFYIRCQRPPMCGNGSGAWTTFRNHRMLRGLRPQYNVVERPAAICTFSVCSNHVTLGCSYWVLEVLTVPPAPSKLL